MKKIKDGKASKLNENMRQFGLRMIFKTVKTLFMSDDEKHGHHFDLPLFLDNIMSNSKQFLAPVPAGVWVLSVFKLVSCKPGASRELALRPQGPEKLHML